MTHIRKPLVGLLSTVATVALTAPAFAACVEDGTDITCSGTSTGINSKTATSLTVSGDVSPAGKHGFKLEADAVEVITSGKINSGSKDALNLSDKAKVTNSGTLEAKDDGISADNQATIVNSGVITAGDKGITVKDSAVITNAGEIITDGEGIQTGDVSRITNKGMIVSAGDDGINPADEAVVINEAGALIKGGDDGVDIDSGLIKNSGEIIGVNGDGIDVDASKDSLVIENLGRISGAKGVNIADGSDGDPENTVTQLVLNGLSLGEDPENAKLVSATPIELVGTGGTAANLGKGNDGFINGRYAGISGEVFMGEGDDVVGFLTLPTNASTATVPMPMLFDGGAGEDQVGFQMSSETFLSMASLSNSDVMLAVTKPNSGSPYDLLLRNFENFAFFASANDQNPTILTMAEVSARLAGQVPLPAGVVLLGSALAGLGVARRRR